MEEWQIKKKSLFGQTITKYLTVENFCSKIKNEKEKEREKDGKTVC